MSTTDRTLAPTPIPLRPLNRTRRRSSSLSAIFSSPELDDSNPHPWTRRTKDDRKLSKRTRVTPQDAPCPNPSSPLKPVQPLFPRLDARTLSNPFSAPCPTVAPPLATTATSAPGFTFTASAFDFSLPHPSSVSPSTTPSRHARHRTASSPAHSAPPRPDGITRAVPIETLDAFRFTSSMTSSRSNGTEPTEAPMFADSSFSSIGNTSTSSSGGDDSSPPSPPSAATSPPSPPRFSFLSSSFPGDGAAVGVGFDGIDRMNCDLDDLEAEVVTKSIDRGQDAANVARLHEAERLHAVAFEQLRRTTLDHEQGFVDRMRQWENERALASSSDRGRQGADSTRRGEEVDEADDEDDEDDEGERPDRDDLELQVEISLDLDCPVLPSLDMDAGSTIAPSMRSTVSPKGLVSRLELDELTQRFENGSCEVEDYGLVREVQDGLVKA
ncbi:hypothetical protein JCM10212_006184 [Sporobolomyces blumeae]